MNMPTLPGVAPAPKRGPGRPKGSGNKRSGDLQRYIEAQYAGMTPGQQSAAIGLVNARDLRAAGGDLLLALAQKAKALAGVLGCTTMEAWVLMHKERVELLPYVHQKRAPKAEEKDDGKPGLTFVAIPMDMATAAGDGATAGEWDTPPDLLQNQGVDVIEGEQVTQPKSHDDT